MFYKRAERYRRIRVNTESACKTLSLRDQCDKFKRTECPLLAQSGHGLVHCTCPLSGVKRTSQ